MNKNRKKSRFSMNRSVSMNQDLAALNSSFSNPINEEEEYEDENGQKKEVKRQIGIFEQFKIKYDELRKENQEKRNEIDQLKRVNKRFEIQILNKNTEFYDKQIKRLRAEVDKLQEESEDFKFKYFESQNKRKQLESSLNVNQKEMTKIIKQFESQKVQNIELKHQLKQNQKQYMNIISTVEESSNIFAKRYAECETKLNTIQNEFKKCKRDFETEKKNVEKLQKAKKQLEEQNKKIIEKFQIQIKNTKKQLDESEDQCRQYRKEIATLKQSLSELNLQMQKNKSLHEFQATKNFEKITQFRSTRLLEIENKRSKQEIQVLKKQLDNKTTSLKTLQIRFDEAKQESEIQKKQNDQNLLDLQKKKTAIQKHYETKNLSLNKEIQILKIKCIRGQSEQQNKKIDLNTNKVIQSQNNQPMFQRKLIESQNEENSLAVIQNSIEEVLKGKNKEIDLLKQTLADKIEEIYKLKQEMQDLQISSQNLKNEIQILSKKWSVQEKNLSSKYEIQFLEMKNQIESLERKLSQSETKIQVKMKEIKEKDSFIVDSIISQIQKQQNVPLILAEMQRILEGGYLEKLADAQIKIKTLERNVSGK